MAGLTTDQQNAVLDYLFSTAAPAMPRPAAWYLAIHSSVPTDDVPATGEFTTTDFASYARQAVTFSRTAGVVANTADISWTIDAGATPPSVVAYSVWDAATGGNCVITQAIAALAPVAGEVVKFTAGSITVTAD